MVFLEESNFFSEMTVDLQVALDINQLYGCAADRSNSTHRLSDFNRCVQNLVVTITMPITQCESICAANHLSGLNAPLVQGRNMAQFVKINGRNVCRGHPIFYARLSIQKHRKSGSRNAYRTASIRALSLKKNRSASRESFVSRPCRNSTNCPGAVFQKINSGHNSGYATYSGGLRFSFLFIAFKVPIALPQSDAKQEDDDVQYVSP